MDTQPPPFFMEGICRSSMHIPLEVPTEIWLTHPTNLPGPTPSPSKGLPGPPAGHERVMS